jgi:hypothetical protein
MAEIQASFATRNMATQTNAVMAEIQYSFATRNMATQTIVAEADVTAWITTQTNAAVAKLDAVMAIHSTVVVVHFDSATHAIATLPAGTAALATATMAELS